VSSGTSTDSPYTVNLNASDGTYTDNEAFNLTIGSSTTITVTDPGEQSNNEGDTVSLQLAATDAASGATFSWSAAGLPTGLSISSAA